MPLDKDKCAETVGDNWSLVWLVVSMKGGS